MVAQNSVNSCTGEYGLSRRIKPIFTIDFWNDGEYVKGCIAGGRRYLHINANGDIECARSYIPTPTSKQSLLDAYRSPLFMQYRSRQPFCDNFLRPCRCWIQPDSLVSMVDKSGARSTYIEKPEDVRKLTSKCRERSEEWAPSRTDCGPERSWPGAQRSDRGRLSGNSRAEGSDPYRRLPVCTSAGVCLLNPSEDV